KKEGGRARENLSLYSFSFSFVRCLRAGREKEKDKEEWRKRAEERRPRRSVCRGLPDADFFGVIRPRRRGVRAGLRRRPAGRGGRGRGGCRARGCGRGCRGCRGGEGRL